jgi:hypothetical protein
MLLTHILRLFHEKGSWNEAVSSLNERGIKNHSSDAFKIPQMSNSLFPRMHQKCSGNHVVTQCYSMTYHELITTMHNQRFGKYYILKSTDNCLAGCFYNLNVISKVQSLLWCVVTNRHNVNINSCEGNHNCYGKRAWGLGCVSCLDSVAKNRWGLVK